MSTTLAKVYREYATTEAGLTLAAGQWGQGQDTGRIKAMRRDGVTIDYFNSASMMSSTGATYGTSLIGSIGINGITPNGGSQGAAATLQNMLTGMAASVVLKAPYSSTANLISIAGDYYGLRIRSYGSQTQNLQQWEKVDGTALVYIDASGNAVFQNSVSSAFGLSVSNGYNTNTAAHAQLYLSVGGSAGGDPKVVFDVSGGTDWAIGIDNSDSDKFKISKSTALGTNDALSIASTGDVTIGAGLSVNGSMYYTSLSAGSVALLGFAGQLTQDNIYWATGGFLGIGATPVEDFHVLKSSVGGSVVAKVENTNNSNAASHARLMAQVGGVSAGDPLLVFRVLSGQDWSIGIDNSDSDKFKISNSAALGTTDWFYIDTSGLVRVNADLSVSNSFQYGSNSFVIKKSAGVNTARLGIAGGSTDATSSGAYIYIDGNDFGGSGLGGGVSINPGTGSAGKLAINGAAYVTGLFGVGAAAVDDFHVKKTTAAGSVVGKIENVDNTDPASHARIMAQVGGGSAGDPLLLLRVNGGQDWSIGIDNSDSDKLKICNSSSVGSNPAMTIDTGLLVTCLASLDVQGNYLKLPTRSSAPSSPASGWMYFNTVSGHGNLYNGTGWIEFG